jgi:hypothetical protein
MNGLGASLYIIHGRLIVNASNSVMNLDHKSNLDS